MFDAGTAVLKTIPTLQDTAARLSTTNLPNNSNEKSNTRTSSSAPGETENVLNRYRNVTYNLTLAALTPDNLKNPDGYRNGKLKYVISSSKGKGAGAISTDITARNVDITEDSDVRDRGGNVVGKKTTVIGAKEDVGAKEIVQEFNKVSPGKFEMFIDGLEVETLLAPNKQTGPAIATKVKFEIFEPMSANGFIEALHVSALAAGWSGYLNACYVLKLDFIGYPDDDPGPVSDATTINATRYFPIKLTGTEMEVTETGTKYRVSAVPFNESGFANPNVIYTDTSFSGNTVKEVIESLFEGINKSTKERAAKEKSPEAAKIVDEYQVFFPEMPKSGESLKIETVDTEISKAKINEQLRSNAVYKFPPIEQSPNATPAGGGRGSANDPRRSDAGEIPKRYDPQKNQIQFSANSNIHEIIEAVIRDSLYFEKVLKDVEAAKKGDGMIDYFQVMINTVPGPMDTTFNQQRFIYQYIICPYKVHYSKLPGQQNSNFDSATMKNYTKRVYNYLYTGNNIDVLSFRLNFNNLFFQAANPKMGNNDKSDTSSGAGASNDPSVKAPTDGAKNAPKDQNDRAPALPSGEAGSTNGRGQPVQQNPYYQIAYAAHQAILESVNMLTGEIEILGDPFYLATGGMGNHLPKLKDYAITTTGEANFNNGPVVVRINFRNPIDIDEATGLATFSKTAVPFSGVYQVLKCQSTLRDGAFKQKLNIMRYNGQIADGSDLKPTKAQQNIQENKPGEQQVVDKAPADVARAGVKPNEINLASWIDKGLPTNGLPGQFANLLGAGNQSLKTVTGALGPAANVLNNIGNLAGGLGIGDALTGINPLSKGIPISASSVSALVGDKLSASAAGLNQIGNQLSSLVPGNVNGLINVQSAQDISSILTGVSNAGSKIINGVSKDIGSIAANASAGVSNLLEVGKGLGDTSGLVSGVQNKIANITSLPSTSLTPLQKSAVIQDAIDKGIPTDQALRNASLFGVNLPGVESNANALASKLGIDTSQLSGLTGKLDSKVISELQDVASNLPSNVNLSSIKEQGIILANIGKDALKNIPAVPPKSTAPIPELPFSVKSDSLSPEVRAKVIQDAVAKGIPVDQALRNAALFGEGALSKIGSLESLTAFGKSAADSAFGKISSIQSGLSGLVGADGGLKAGLTTAMGVKGSVESQISSVQNMLGNPQLGTTQLANLGKSVTSQFGSLSGSVASPLEKFMNNSVNSLNDPNAPPYTGTDPIVRRRLGLPPIEEA
jgi:hypothetical protein